MAAKEQLVGTIEGLNGTTITATLHGKVTLVFSGKDGHGKDATMTYKRLANGTVKHVDSGWIIPTRHGVGDTMVVSKDEFAATVFGYFADRMASALENQAREAVNMQEQAYLIAERKWEESGEAAELAGKVWGGEISQDAADRIQAQRLYALANHELAIWTGDAEGTAPISGIAEYGAAYQSKVRMPAGNGFSEMTVDNGVTTCLEAARSEKLAGLVKGETIEVTYFDSGEPVPEHLTRCDVTCSSSFHKRVA